MNKAFINDIKKISATKTIKQELDPGTTSRRYEPAGGIGKHNERIHRESRSVDEHRNLPFTFRKPPKSIGRSMYVKCDNCGNVTCATTVTVGVICKECKKFSSVSEVNFD